MFPFSQQLIPSDDLLPPQVGAKLNPSLLNVEVDNPPQESPSANAVEFATQTSWAADPWPYVFVGGKQPYQQSHLYIRYGYEQPPIGSRETPQETAISAFIARPDEWPYAMLGGAQPYQPRHGTPSYIGRRVDLPPPRDGAKSQLGSTIVRTWDAPSPSPFVGGMQPLAPRILYAALLEVPVNRPPRNEMKLSYIQLYDAWSPQAPLPTLRETSVYDIIPIGFSFGIFIG